MRNREGERSERGVATVSIAKRIGSKENIKVSGKTSRTRISEPREREREREISNLQNDSLERRAQKMRRYVQCTRGVSELLLIINLTTNSLVNWKRIFPWKKSRKRIVDIVGFFNA